MSSLTDLINNNLSKSSSHNYSSERASMDESKNSIQHTEDNSSLGSIEQNSIFETILSTPSIQPKISPLSTALNSVDEKLQSATKLEDIVTSTEHMKTESGSFNSHTHLNNNDKIKTEPDGDLRLPLAEEQCDACNARRMRICSIKTRHTHSADPIANLVSATLAFRESSNNQCNLLKAQTDAINRLAMAIEDQNNMMSRFHTIGKKPSTKNLGDNTE